MSRPRGGSRRDRPARRRRDDGGSYGDRYSNDRSATGRPVRDRSQDGSRRWRRAQSHVVGVSLMVAVTVLALGGLTVAIGTVVDSGANTAEANRVADAMTVVAEPGDVVGTAEAELRFGDGRLRTDRRTIRLIDGSNGSVIERVDGDVLVYTVGDYTVVGGSGAVLRASGGGAVMVESPSIAADRGAGNVLLVGVPSIDASAGQFGTNTGASVSLRASVDHERRDLGERDVRIAVETAYPDAWADYFERKGALIVDRDASFGGSSGGDGAAEGDGLPDTTNVVAEFPGQHQTYLLVHETELEVGS